jgi:hypothetical protein
MQFLNLNKEEIKKLKRQFTVFLILATILEFTNLGSVFLRQAGLEELVQRAVVQNAHAAGNVVIFVSSTAQTTWTVPNDWDNAHNTIEVIGGGGGGANGVKNATSAGGGGGAAYAKISNWSTSTTGGLVNIKVASGGGVTQAGSSTWFNGDTCAGAAVCAAGGGGAPTSTGVAGSGGLAANSTGTTLSSGGDGGYGGRTVKGLGGGGGGGAGGQYGTGGRGGSSGGTAPTGGGGGGGNGSSSVANYGATSTTATAGSGGNGSCGGTSCPGGTGGTVAGPAGKGGGGGAGGGGRTSSAGYAGGVGASSTEWTQTSDSQKAGPGGGGGGGGGNSGTGSGATGGDGGNAGLYGGGGGGGGATSNGTPAAGAGKPGAQGIIVITYTPLTPTTPGTPTFTNVGTSTLTVSWTAATGTINYDLQRSTDGSSFSHIASTTLLTYNDTSLSNGTAYWYKVRGANTTGDVGSFSSSASTTTTSVLDATSFTDSSGFTNGGRSGDSIVITGTKFGSVDAGSRTNCAGGAGTGCIQLLGVNVNATATVADGDITAWSDTSITFNISTTLATLGGSSTLQVCSAGTCDVTPLTFYVYPHVTSMATCTNCNANAGREYNASDTDGIIMLSGDHFGVATGTMFFSGNFNNASATLHNGIALAQGIAGNVFDSTASATVAFGSNVTAGNLIVAMYQSNDTSASDTPKLSDVSQSAGTCTVGTWTMDSVLQIHGVAGYLSAAIYSVPVTGSGSCTIKVGRGKGRYSTLGIIEVSGADTSATRVDATVQGSSTVSTNPPATAAFNTQAGDLIAGSMGLDDASTDLTGKVIQGTNYTLVYKYENGANDQPGSAVYRISNRALTGETVSWTRPNSGDSGWTGFSAVAVAYKAAATSAGPCTALGWNGSPGNNDTACVEVPQSIGDQTYTGSVNLVRAFDSSGTVNTWVTNTTALPSAIIGPSTVVNNGYIYVTGGTTSTVGVATSTVSYAPINSTGSIGAWATTTALPSGLVAHSAVVNNGYIYAIGGINGSSNTTSTVFYAPINSTGSIGAWATTTALPKAIYSHSAVVNNGYVYVTGGATSTTGVKVTSTVLYAPFNSNGSIGAWATTTALPSATYSHSAVVNNGYIYVTGGATSTTTGGGTSTVSYAPINSTGSIGAWSRTTALPGAIYLHSAVVYNGYIYTTGGAKAGVVTSTVYYAPINATGSIGNWTSTTALPNAIFSHSAVVNSGYVYVTGGGDSGGVATTTVSYAPLKSNFDSIGFRALPRILSNTPPSSSTGAVVQILGNHFCQSGTCPTASTAISFVNASNTAEIAAASTTNSVTLNVSSTNLIVIACRSGGTDILASSVSDAPLNNTWNLAAAKSDGGSVGAVSIFYTISNGSSVSDKITCTYPSAVQWLSNNVVQYSGVAQSNPLDATSTISVGGQGNVTSTAFTTTQANEVIIAFASQATNNTTFAAGNNYTLRAGNESGADQMAEDWITTSIQSNQVAGASSADTTDPWIMDVATFKAATNNSVTVSDNVKFGSTTSTASDFVAQTNGTGACNGTGVAWDHDEICVKVPSGTPAGSASTTITSNTSYTSNAMAFNASASLSTIPDGPANLAQYTGDGATSLSVGSSTASTTVVFRANLTASTTINIQLQVEAISTANSFVCSGTGACAAAATSGIQHYSPTAISFVASSSASVESSANATTPDINTTGATLLVVGCISTWNSGATSTVTDSENSTWHPLTQRGTSGSGGQVQIFYSYSEKTNTNHNFTCSNNGTYLTMVVSAWKGTATDATVFDQESGGQSSSNTSGQPGSITPAGSGELFVTMSDSDDSPSSYSIDSSFNILWTDSNNSDEVGGHAYLINSGSSAQNPTWTLGGNSKTFNMAMAAFKPASGAAATVALLNSNTPTLDSGGSASNAMTVNAGGSNVVAFAAVEFDGGGTSATATYNGLAMTAVGPASYNSSENNAYIQAFYLINPPTGSHDLNVTVTGGESGEVYTNLVVFSGVDQATPVRPGTYQSPNNTSTDSGGTYSLPVSSNSNDLTWACQSSGPTIDPTDQTTDTTDHGGTNQLVCSHATTGASSVTHTFGTYGSTPITIFGFSIQAASGAFVIMANLPSAGDTGTSYHWQARAWNTDTGEASAWTSFAGNAESSADFIIDANPPTISSVATSSVSANAATITWNTSGESADSRVQYGSIAHPARVQFKHTESPSNVTSTTVNVSSTAAGDLLTLFIAADDNAHIQSSTIVDSQGDVFLKAVCQNGSYDSGNCLYYYPNAPANVTSVTITALSAQYWFVLGFTEYSGIATSSPLDATSSYRSVSTTSTTWTSGYATTAASGELFTGAVVGGYNNSIATTTAPWAWASGGNFEAGHGNATVLIDYFPTGAAGSYVATGTMSGPDEPTALIASFKAASGSGGFDASCSTYNDCTAVTDAVPPGTNSHSVTLTGLATSTTYFFRVRSKDALSNEGSSTVSSFTTTSGGGASTLPATGNITSAVFDTGSSSTGAAYNSILWKGTAGTGKARFQLATSDSSSGPWTYYGSEDGGTTCDANHWYTPGGAGAPVELSCAPKYHNNNRFFRYKIQLCSATDCSSIGATSPSVTGVVVNWSP